MCLLVVLAGVHPEWALVVAANRDELLERPADAMAVLRPADPRILGGRDQVGGGTWLAVNEFGVVAGLTNRPAVSGHDPTKRSRGELALALATHPTAEAAVEDFRRSFRPSDYNAAWLLVGDAHSLHALAMTDGEQPVVERLSPGLHILENYPPGTNSPKVTHVRSLLSGVEGLKGDELVGRLRAVLSNHQPPPVPPGGRDVVEAWRPVEASAACVHSELYGTRWSGIVTVAEGGRPRFLYADGHPCTSAWVDAGPHWTV
jgi:uncharacterized protein with NRDE domain